MQYLYVWPDCLILSLARFFSILFRPTIGRRALKRDKY